MDETINYDALDHKARWAAASARIKSDAARLNAATIEIQRRHAALRAERAAEWDRYIEGCRAAKQSSGDKHEQLRNLQDAVKTYSHEVAAIIQQRALWEKSRGEWQMESGIMDNTHPDIAHITRNINELKNSLNAAKKCLQLAQNKLARLQVSTHAAENDDYSYLEDGK
jgi:Trp operon repressor